MFIDFKFRKEKLLKSRRRGDPLTANVGAGIIKDSNLRYWLIENHIPVFCSMKSENGHRNRKNRTIPFLTFVEIPDSKKDLQVYFKLKWG